MYMQNGKLCSCLPAITECKLSLLIPSHVYLKRQIVWTFMPKCEMIWKVGCENRPHFFASQSKKTKWIILQTNGKMHCQNKANLWDMMWALPSSASLQKSFHLRIFDLVSMFGHLVEPILLQPCNSETASCTLLYLSSSSPPQPKNALEKPLTSCLVMVVSDCLILWLGCLICYKFGHGSFHCLIIRKLNQESREWSPTRSRAMIYVSNSKSKVPCMAYKIL